VERIALAGSRTSASLPDEDELTPGLQYLFAAGGPVRIAGPEFEPFDLPMGGIAAVPAASPEFIVERLGGSNPGTLELVRIVPRWPAADR
jgi:hypothetical protein